MSQLGKAKKEGSDGKLKAAKNRSLPVIYGAEGTNKTMPQPQPDAQPFAELMHTTTRFIPKSPYTRG